MEGADGVLHLAAVSRVVAGEQDPERCIATNVGGTENIVRAALAQDHPPFVLLASSREVYGEPRALPVREDEPLAPMNVYARTKRDGEALLGHARREGLRTAVIRLSNVYGDPQDHVDRVVPAFARAALLGGELRVEGSGNTFDFVWLDDAVDGILRAADRAAVEQLPPIHLATGRGTTLGELASLAIAIAGRGRRREMPPRRYDVVRFVGDPSRAEALLGWRARTSVEDGLSRFIAAVARETDAPLAR